MNALEDHVPEPSSYRASLIKRRRPRPAPPSAPSVPASAPPQRNLEMELRREQRARIEAERRAIAQVEAITATWNDELSSTVPSLASVVSRAVAAIVGEAPCEDVVENALRREVARVRGDHRPVLRVAASDRREWIDALVARGEKGDTRFTVRRDEMLSPGKCILELGARRVDLSPETQLAAFDDHVRGGIGDIETPSAPPLPEVALDPLDEAVKNDAEPAKAPGLVRADATNGGATVTRPARTATGSGASVKITRGSVSDGSGKSEEASGLASARNVTSREARATVKAPMRPRSEPKARIERVAAPPVEKASAPTKPPAEPPAAAPSFDELDLGEGAARFDAPPPPGEPARDHEAASHRAPEGIEAMASAVSALRARVSRDVSAMRSLVEEADGSGKAQSRDTGLEGDASHAESPPSARWASVVDREGGSGNASGRDLAGDRTASAGIRGILAERAEPIVEADAPEPPRDPLIRTPLQTGTPPRSVDEAPPNDAGSDNGTAANGIDAPRESARERRRRSLNLPPWMAALGEEPSQ